MKKLITMLFMLFSIVSFSQPNIDAYRVRARNWIIYGNDTIFRPTHIDAADYQIKTVADPTDPQDAVNLRTMNDFAGDSTFNSIVIRDSLFIFSDTIIYITVGDSLVTKEYLDSLVATLPGGHDPVTLHNSATTGGLTISASQVVGFQPSSATSNGYLSAANFTLFFNKLTTVTHDATLTGLGTVASPLKVDTTLIATKTDVNIAGDDWGTDYVILNSDSLLKGRGTTATPLRADSTLLATKAFTNLTYVQLGDSLTKWVTFKQLIDSLGTLPGGHDPVTLGTANGLSLSTQELSLNTANAGTTGAILNTDWAEFNAKMDSVNRLSPLTGYGTSVNPLGIDTANYVATKYDLTSVVAGSVTLSGQVTGSGTGTIATVLDKTAITAQDLNASIATNDSILIYDQSGADLDKTSVANLGAVNGAFDAGWLQNVAVSSTAPFNNYVLLYDSITTQWKPAVSPSSKWASDTYGINYQLGNVGIGTTSVSGNKLKVYTTSSMNAAALFEGGSTSHGIAIVSGNTSSHRALDLYNYTGSRNLMRITSDGRVNFPLYGTTSTFDGAVTKLLGVDATGAMYTTSGFAGGEVTSVAGTYLNNQIPRFTGTSGDTLQTSPYPVTINDSGQLAVAATYSGDYGARFINNSSLGYGALIQGGNTAVQDILRLSSYGGTMQFQFKPTGTMYAHNLGTGKTDSVLYWNATTKQITVGDISSLGSKWSSVSGGINYPSGYVGINNATPAYALDIASTEDVAQLYSSNTKNNEQVLRLKLGGTGGDYLRMLNGSGVSYFNFHALGYFQQKSISTAPSAISGYGQWYTYNDKPTFMSGAGTVYNLMTDPLTTRGDIMYRSSTATTRLPIGSANTVLSSNGTDVSWQPGGGGWTDGDKTVALITSTDDVGIGGAANSSYKVYVTSDSGASGVYSTSALTTGYAGNFVNTGESGLSYGIYASTGSVNGFAGYFKGRLGCNYVSGGASGYAVYVTSDAPLAAGHFNNTGTGYGIYASTSNASTYSGYFSGGLGVIATNFILSSDARLKNNIRNIRDLSWVDKLNFKQFTMKDDLSDRLRFGLIAQDVQKLQPDMVYENEKGELSLSYTDILISIVSRQRDQISDLEKRIEKLEKLMKK